MDIYPESRSGASEDDIDANGSTMKARKNLILGLILGSAVLGLLFVFHGYGNTWRLWNIPAASPPFMDLRVITAGAEAYRQGLDPMTSNPSDSSQRKLNYPRIWQGLYVIGIGPAHTVPLGIVSILLFGVGVCAFVPRVSNTGVAFIMAAVFSPAVLLGVERGNTDLLMFFLLALAVAWAERSQILSVVLVLFGFVLKLFPLLGLVVVLGRPRGFVVKSVVVGVALAVLYVWFSFDDLLRISAATPRDTWLSYGMNVLWMKVAAQNSTAGLGVRILSHCTVLGAALWAGVAWWEGAPAGARKDGPYTNAFRVGGACYVGTFLLGNNFDYRLMFLVFTIPQLLAWAGDASGSLSRVARIALIGLYVSMWSMLIDSLLQAWPWGSWVSFLFGEAAKWTAFYTMLYLLLSSGPEWVAQTARKWFSWRPKQTRERGERFAHLGSAAANQ